MRRLRVLAAPKGTLDLLLNLSNRHIHAQLVDKKAGRVILAAHTNEPAIRADIARQANTHINGYATANVKAAGRIGDIFARRAQNQGISAVYWRSPGKYHGKIKAFIDAVRAQGIRTLKAPKHNTPPPPDAI